MSLAELSFHHQLFFRCKSLAVQVTAYWWDLCCGQKAFGCSGRLLPSGSTKCIKMAGLEFWMSTKCRCVCEHLKSVLVIALGLTTAVSVTPETKLSCCFKRPSVCYQPVFDDPFCTQLQKPGVLTMVALGFMDSGGAVIPVPKGASKNALMSQLLSTWISAVSGLQRKYSSFWQWIFNSMSTFSWNEFPGHLTHLLFFFYLNRVHCKTHL